MTSVVSGGVLGASYQRQATTSGEWGRGVTEVGQQCTVDNFVTKTQTAVGTYHARDVDKGAGTVPFEEMFNLRHLATNSTSVHFVLRAGVF